MCVIVVRRMSKLAIVNMDINHPAVINSLLLM
jgi:hypothetical protein